MARKQVFGLTRLLCVGHSMGSERMVLREQWRSTFTKTSGSAGPLRDHIIKSTVAYHPYCLSRTEIYNECRAFHNNAQQRIDHGETSSKPEALGQSSTIELDIPHETASYQATPRINAGQDTSAERAEVEKSENPSLPRTKIPMHPANADFENGSIKGTSINQDVYYTQDGNSTPADHLDLSGLANIGGVFSSSKVSAILGGQQNPLRNPYNGRKKVVSKPLPEMLAAEEARRRQVADAGGQHSSGDSSKAGI